MSRTPLQAALGAILDEGADIKKYIVDLEAGVAIERATGKPFTPQQQAEMLPRLKELRAENDAAYQFLREMLERPAADESAKPVDTDELRYAQRLATSIWERCYRDSAPHWKPLDDVMGVLTQIDNMVSGLTRFEPASTASKEAKPVAPSSLPPPFRDWFNRAWNSFEDKGHVNMVYCMAWALKAYRAFSVPAPVASKEAVSLSDEEIVKCWLETPRGMSLSKYHGVLVFARAILAILATRASEAARQPKNETP